MKSERIVYQIRVCMENSIFAGDDAWMALQILHSFYYITLYHKNGKFTMPHAICYHDKG
jgi:hypothetical protein